MTKKILLGKSLQFYINKVSSSFNISTPSEIQRFYTSNFSKSKVSL